jgi:hypothetical protein
MRVTVEDGRIVDVTPLALDGARWAHLSIDVADLTSEADVMTRIRATMNSALEQSEGRPLAVRITLVGATELHGRFVARREALQDDIRAGGFQLSADCWVEQLKIKTTVPPRPSATSSAAERLDAEHLLSEAANDPEFATILAELIETIKTRLPKDLHGELSRSDALQTLAEDARALLAGELS